MLTYNAALLLNESLTTVKAHFGKSHVSRDGDFEFTRVSGDYTFFCEKTLAKNLTEGDLVLCVANSQFQVVCVSEIDDDADIDHDAGFEYNFIFQRVDTELYFSLTEAVSESTDYLNRRRTSDLRQRVAAEYGIESLEDLSKK